MVIQVRNSTIEYHVDNPLSWWHNPMDHKREFETEEECQAWIDKRKKIWAKMEFRIMTENEYLHYELTLVIWRMNHQN